MKRLAFAGMALAATMGMLATGCQSDKQAATGTPLYRVFEESNKIENANKAECIRLFDGQKDKVGTDSSMAQLNLAQGAQIEERIVTGTGEVYYALSGSGMIKVNEIAYILRENSGIYIPAGNRVIIQNNGTTPMKCLVMAKSLRWLDGPLKNPMPFDKRDPQGNAITKSYDEIVGSKPQNLAPQELNPTSLTPSEAKVKTLQDEKYQ